MNNYKVKFYVTPRHSSHSQECNQEEKVRIEAINNDK